MVAFLFYDMSLVYDFADYFDIYGNAYSTCAMEKSIDPYSCVIVSFSAKFPFSAALIMAASREQIFLVGRSYLTPNTTS